MRRAIGRSIWLRGRERRRRRWWRADALLLSSRAKARSAAVVVIPSEGAERRSRGTPMRRGEQNSSVGTGVPRLASLARDDNYALRNDSVGSTFVARNAGTNALAAVAAKRK